MERSIHFFKDHAVLYCAYAGMERISSSVIDRLIICSLFFLPFFLKILYSIPPPPPFLTRDLKMRPRNTGANCASKLTTPSGFSPFRCDEGAPASLSWRGHFPLKAPPAITRGVVGIVTSSASFIAVIRQLQVAPHRLLPSTPEQE